VGGGPAASLKKQLEHFIEPRSDDPGVWDRGPAPAQRPWRWWFRLRNGHPPGRRRWL